MFKILICFSILAVVVIRAQGIRSKRQSFFPPNCPNGGCSCVCNCNGGGGGGCPPCPTIYPPTYPPNGTTPFPTMGTTPSGGNFTANCFQMIRAAANLSAGQLIGLLLTTLLSNLVVPILQIVLTGNNTLEGAVIPLANILCYIVGILLLLLRSLGLLGLLGAGGLLQNILGGIGGSPIG